MVNSGSFDSDVDRNEKGKFTQPRRMAESPHSASSALAVSGSLCENDFPTQTADSLPVSQAIEPTATKTEFKCSMSGALTHAGGPLAPSRPRERDADVTLISDGEYPADAASDGEKCGKDAEVRARVSVCCSVPLEKVQGVLKTCGAAAAAAKERLNEEAKLPPRKDLCLYCDRSFLTSSLRQRHVDRYHSLLCNRRSSGRRPVVKHSMTTCMFCSSFGSANCTLKQLFEHLVLEHPRKYFGCLDCETRFPCFQDFKEHCVDIHDGKGMAMEQNPLRLVLNEKGDNNLEVMAKPLVSEAKLISDKLRVRDKVNSSSGVIGNQKTVRVKIKNKYKYKTPGLNENKKGEGYKEKSLSTLPVALEPIKLSQNSRARVLKENKVFVKDKQKANWVKELRSKKVSVVSTKMGVKQCIRVTRQQTKRLENVKTTKKKAKPAKNDNDKSDISTKYLAFQNRPYSAFDVFRIKKITDHSIDNIRISSLTFDDVFDKTFFNRVRCNIQENLLNHIDGKLFKSLESENRISNFQKLKDVQSDESSQSYGCKLTTNAVAPIAISLLADSQFGEDIESQIEYGSKPSKKKAATVVNDEVHYKYFTRRKYQTALSENKQNRDLSKLDMWTQLAVKNRQQKILRDQKTDKEMLEYMRSDEYRVKMQVEELDKILDKRGPLEDLKEEAMRSVALEKLNGTVDSNVESYFDVSVILNELLNSLFSTDVSADVAKEKCEKKKAFTASFEYPMTTLKIGDEIPNVLNLRRVSRENATDKVSTADEEKPAIAELTGEWARSRIYVCAACGIKVPNAKSLVDHKNLYHEHVWCQHYEFVGNQGELYRHLSIPALGKVGEIESSGSKMWRRSDARVCSKCNKHFNCLGDLHRHMLECGGDWSWVLARKKYKYRPYGSKPRKRRRGLLKFMQAFRERKVDQARDKLKPIKKFDGPRQKPSDADTIQRMLANLPAKRITRKIISLKDGFQRTIKTKAISKTKKNAGLKQKTQKKAVGKTAPHKGLKKIGGKNTRRLLRSNSVAAFDKINLILPKFAKGRKDSSGANSSLRRHSSRNLNKVFANKIMKTNNSLLKHKTEANQEKVNEVVENHGQDDAQIEIKTDKKKNVKEQKSGNVQNKENEPKNAGIIDESIKDTVAAVMADQSMTNKKRIKKKKNIYIKKYLNQQNTERQTRAHAVELKPKLHKISSESELKPKLKKSKLNTKVKKKIETANDSNSNSENNTPSLAQNVDANAKRNTRSAYAPKSQKATVQHFNKNFNANLRTSCRNQNKVANKVKKAVQKLRTASKKLKRIQTKSLVTEIVQVDGSSQNRSTRSKNPKKDSFISPSFCETSNNHVFHLNSQISEESSKLPKKDEAVITPENVYLNNGDVFTITANPETPPSSELVNSENPIENKNDDSITIANKVEDNAKDNEPEINLTIKQEVDEPISNTTITVKPSPVKKTTKKLRGLNDCIAMLTNKLQDKHPSYQNSQKDENNLINHINNKSPINSSIFQFDGFSNKPNFVNDLNSYPCDPPTTSIFSAAADLEKTPDRSYQVEDNCEIVRTEASLPEPLSSCIEQLNGNAQNYETAKFAHTVNHYFEDLSPVKPPRHPMVKINYVKTNTNSGTTDQDTDKSRSEIDTNNSERSMKEPYIPQIHIKIQGINFQQNVDDLEMITPEASDTEQDLSQSLNKNCNTDKNVFDFQPYNFSYSEVIKCKKQKKKYKKKKLREKFAKSGQYNHCTDKRTESLIRGKLHNSKKEYINGSNICTDHIDDVVGCYNFSVFNKLHENPANEKDKVEISKKSHKIKHKKTKKYKDIASNNCKNQTNIFDIFNSQKAKENENETDNVVQFVFGDQVSSSTEVNTLQCTDTDENKVVNNEPTVDNSEISIEVVNDEKESATENVPCSTKEQSSNLSTPNQLPQTKHKSNNAIKTNKPKNKKSKKYKKSLKVSANSQVDEMLEQMKEQLLLNILGGKPTSTPNVLRGTSDSEDDIPLADLVKKSNKTDVTDMELMPISSNCILSNEHVESPLFENKETSEVKEMCSEKDDFGVDRGVQEASLTDDILTTETKTKDAEPVLKVENLKIRLPIRNYFKKREKSINKKKKNLKKNKKIEKAALPLDTPIIETNISYADTELVSLDNSVEVVEPVQKTCENFCADELGDQTVNEVLENVNDDSLHLIEDTSINQNVIENPDELEPSLEDELRNEDVDECMDNENNTNNLVHTHEFVDDNMVDATNISNSIENTTSVEDKEENKSDFGASEPPIVKAKSKCRPRSKMKVKSKLSIQNTKSNFGKLNNAFCDICNKTFSRSENLAKHKRTLTHIAKLSELEALQAAEKAKEAEKQEEMTKSLLNSCGLPTSSEFVVESGNDEDVNTNVPPVCEEYSRNVEMSAFALPSAQDSLKLVDIISDVLSKPIENEFSKHSNFSDLILQSDPEIKRCKSLGERKSFDCDKVQPYSNTSSSIHNIDLNQKFGPKLCSTADLIVEKQISLLENIIEDNQLNFKSADRIFVSANASTNEDYSSQSNSSEFSLLSTSKPEDCNDITFTHNTNIITNLIKPSIEEENLIQAAQYEEISEDSNSSRFPVEEQKSRKALNRDEELFLECCSLLKSSSDMSDLCKKSAKSNQFLNNFGLKSLDELEWLEQKHLSARRNAKFESVPNNFISDDSHINTSVSDHFYNDLSYSNSDMSNSNLNMKTIFNGNETSNVVIPPPIFEDISRESDGSSTKFIESFKTSSSNITMTAPEVNECLSPNVESAQIPEECEEVNGENYEEVEEQFVEKAEVKSTVEENTPDLEEVVEERQEPAPKLTQACITDYVTQKTPKENQNKKMLTKGAMKVFEGLKVSIPKEELDMTEVLNCSPTCKRLKLETAGETAGVERKLRELGSINKPSKKIGNKLGLKVTKKNCAPKRKSSFKVKVDGLMKSEKKCHDIYDFEETQDNMDVFHSAADSFPVYRSFRNKLSSESSNVEKTNENSGSLNSTETFCDDYEEDTYDKDSMELPPIVVHPSKKVDTSKSITKKKCMIMGRIFKNVAKSKMSDDIRNIPTIENSKMVEDFVLNCQEVQLEKEISKEHKLSEEEMNMLFDNLLNEEKMRISGGYKERNNHHESESSFINDSKPKHKINNKLRKKSRCNSSDSSDEEFSIKMPKRHCNKKSSSDQCVINLEQELKECIGVASRKSQRKCTSGKQNVLVEHWSSDESNFDIDQNELSLKSLPKVVSKTVEDVRIVPSTNCSVDNSNIMKNYDKQNGELTETSVTKSENSSCSSSSNNLNLHSMKKKKKHLENRHSLKQRNSEKELPKSESRASAASTTEIQQQNAETIALSRKKRTAVDTLYYWSSSSEDELQDVIQIKSPRDEYDDDEERPQHHGWIVGDSPKKLVTMLAQAKGKKLDVECVKKNKKKKTGV